MDAIVDNLAQEYWAIGGKSAENVLALAKMIAKVKYELGERYQNVFYERVRLDPKGTTVVKLRAIAEEAEWFEAHLDVIPNTWTTLYPIAKMSEAERTRLLESGRLHPAATMTEIYEALGKKDAKAKKSFKVVIDLGALGERSKQELAQSLDELGKKDGVKPNAPNHQEELKKLIARKWTSNRPRNGRAAMVVSRRQPPDHVLQSNQPGLWS